MEKLFKTLGADVVPYNIICSNFDNAIIYPYLRSDTMDKEKMYLVSPDHGRSYVVSKKDDRYIVSKGNGLSYTSYSFLNTMEFGNDTWGLLLKQDAIRDFTIGNEVKSLGIKTNSMEYVLELDKQVHLPNGSTLKPTLLQYSVECPYRITDAAYMTDNMIKYWIEKWDKSFSFNYQYRYQIAAEVLIRNLHILQKNGILHNAITPQNYTWALELLDFEIAHSPNYPYNIEDAHRHVVDLFPREIIYTYQIIITIATHLNEPFDFCWIEHMFNKYDFDLKQFAIFIK